jgi:hypothetical protein
VAYKSREHRRTYNTAYQRARRAGCQTRGQAVRQSEALAAVRITCARELREVLVTYVNAVSADTSASTLAKARTVAMLAGPLLRAIEAEGLTARVEAIERTLSTRKGDEHGS